MSIQTLFMGWLIWAFSRLQVVCFTNFREVADERTWQDQFIVPLILIKEEMKHQLSSCDHHTQIELSCSMVLESDRRNLHSNFTLPLSLLNNIVQELHLGPSYISPLSLQGWKSKDIILVEQVVAMTRKVFAQTHLVCWLFSRLGCATLFPPK